MASFYGYARELTNVREGLRDQEQKVEFDLGVRNNKFKFYIWICFLFLHTIGMGHDLTRSYF